MNGVRKVLTHSHSLALAALAILGVSALVAYDMGNPSPGPLAAVHAQIPSLSAVDRCAACHGGTGQSMTEACLQCHAEIGAQLDASRGFHGCLSNDLRSACHHCHAEHHGHDFPLTNRQGFALAGVAARDQYDHHGLDFQLQGKHAALACRRCHPQADTEVLPVGTPRFLGLSQDCTACHQDVHQRTYGQDCSSCHGQDRPFAEAAEFQHTTAFALQGAHRQVACKSCHAADSPHSVKNLLDSASAGGRNKHRPVRLCQACHSLPHSNDFLRLAAAAPDRPPLTCGQCHPAEQDGFRGPLATIDADVHALVGFALEAPHDKAACRACHPGYAQPKTDAAAFHASFPGRLADDCQACHGDPHRGQFAQGRFREVACVGCHERHAFAPSRFDSAAHALTKFPLEGAHAHLACRVCHRSTSGDADSTGHAFAMPQFQGTPASCGACHPDPHQGQFAAGVFAGADCNACHSQETFRHATMTIAQHAHTRFPLTGAHEAVGCAQCHPRNAASAGALDPSAAAASRQFRGTPTHCRACHQDVHRGAFDRPGLPSTLGGAGDCARCHTTERFDLLRPLGFDHAVWTGYALQGAHAKAGCAACHPRTTSPDSAGRTFGRIASRQCQSCHTDPHVGQFGPTARVDCTQCHAVGLSFRELVFNHQKNTRFPLDRDHAQLACAACHKPQRLPNGNSAIRYRPLGVKCGDCHVPRRADPRRGRNEP